MVDAKDKQEVKMGIPDITKLLKIRGVPARYLRVKLTPKFGNIVTDRQGKNVYVSSKSQQKFYENFKENPFDNLVIGIHSNVNDNEAMSFAALLFKHAVMKETQEGKCYWLNSYESDFIKPNVGLVVVSNVMPNATQGRLQNIRDILTYYNEIPRIVVVAGIDSISFFDNYLYHPLNAVFYITSNARTREI